MAKTWRHHFESEEMEEIGFCMLCHTQHLGKGTQGHYIRTIIAKLANLLDAAMEDLQTQERSYEEQLKELKHPFFEVKK